MRAIDIKYTFIDAKGKKSSTVVHIRGDVDEKQSCIEFTQEIAYLIAKLTGCLITSATVCFHVDLSGAGLKTIPASVSSVAKKLDLSFRTDVTGFFAKTSIPGLIETDVIDGSGDVDQSDPDIAATISMFEDGIAVTAGTMVITNQRAIPVVSIMTAKERFLKRKKA